LYGLEPTSRGALITVLFGEAQIPILADAPTIYRKQHTTHGRTCVISVVATAKALLFDATNDGIFEGLGLDSLSAYFQGGFTDSLVWNEDRVHYQ
jgi:hypothetical protein